MNTIINGDYNTLVQKRSAIDLLAFLLTDINSGKRLDNTKKYSLDHDHYVKLAKLMMDIDARQNGLNSKLQQLNTDEIWEAIEQKNANSFNLIKTIFVQFERNDLWKLKNDLYKNIDTDSINCTFAELISSIKESKLIQVQFE